MGVPFVAVRGLLGTDILKNRPDLKVVPNPFHPGEKVVVVPPIRPDVAVFHALRADRWGNAITPGLRDDLMMARAASRVLITAEEIAEKELKKGDGVEDTFLPAIDVDAVVPLPRGAHPCACGTLYPWDEDHLRKYMDAAQDEAKFKNYLDEYVMSVRDHQEYLRRVGIRSSSPEEKANG